MVDMVCELKDGICLLCGKDPNEDCPLTDLSPELAEWSERDATKVWRDDPFKVVVTGNDECESCQ